MRHLYIDCHSLVQFPSFSPLNLSWPYNMNKKKIKKIQKKEEEKPKTNPKERNPNSRCSTRLCYENVVLQAKEDSGWRDEATRRRSMRGSPKLPRKSRGTAAKFWIQSLIFCQLIHLTSRTFCKYLILRRLDLYSPDTASNTRIQGGLLEALQIGIQEIQINYPKWVQLRSYYFFNPGLLIICIINQNTGEENYFIHKSGENCKMRMQNGGLITPPHLSFALPEKNKKNKN